MKNTINKHIPQFRVPLEGARRGFLVEVHVHMISSQIATPQISHMLAHLEHQATSDKYFVIKIVSIC